LLNISVSVRWLKLHTEIGILTTERYLKLKWNNREFICSSMWPRDVCASELWHYVLVTDHLLKPKA